MTPIDLWVNRETPSQNKRERWHWSRQRNEVKAWATLFFYAARGVIVPCTTKRHVTIVAYRRKRCGDEANFHGGCKGLIDGLVRAKLLKDDSREWATFEYLEALASKSPTRKAGTHVVIEDVQPAHPCTPASP